MTVVAIHQPNFLPWLGYFHKLLNCDVFVFLDDVQFPRGKSYASRVTIKSPAGPAWLTVPVKGKGDMVPIKEILTADMVDWKRKHLRTLEASYKRAPYFKDYFPLIEKIYKTNYNNLADFNISLIKVLAECFSARTKMIRASDFTMDGIGTLEHLIRLVKHIGGKKYLTGTGKGSFRYLDEEVFDGAGIKVLYQNFIHPQYPQLWGEFAKNLSAVDLLFNCGAGSRRIIDWDK